MPIIEGSKSIAEGPYGGAAFKAARGDYDFAKDGGAIGNVNLIGSVVPPLPAGAIILGGFIEIDTVLTSGGAATVALQSEAAGDLLAAAAIAGAPWSSLGRKSILPAFTGASAVKTTAARDLVMVIAAAALTAGKFKVVVFYIEEI